MGAKATTGGEGSASRASGASLGIAGLLVLTMALAGCAGGDTTDSEPEDESTAPQVEEDETVEVEVAVDEPAAVAVLEIITQLIQTALGGAGFEPAVAGQELAVGDEVQTDDTGFAEVVYHDGSWQRIEANGTLTVLELVDATDGSAVRTTIDIGRTWNNVRELVTPDDRYELETPVATATVRGTIFATDCDDEPRCTFTAVEGEVEIEPVDGESFLLVAPATVTIGPDEIEGPETVFPDLLRQDAWVATNLELDFDRAEQLPERPTTTTDPALLATAVLDGTYDVIRTITDTNWPFHEPVAERIYRAETRCDDDGCRFLILIETVLIDDETGEIGAGDDILFDVAYDAGTYRGEAATTLPCPNLDRTGVETAWTLEISPTAATRTARGWHADSFDGRTVVANVPDLVCYPDGFETEDGSPSTLESSTLEGTRQTSDP